jgi:hypothetical protein
VRDLDRRSPSGGSHAKSASSPGRPGVRRHPRGARPAGLRGRRPLVRRQPQDCPRRPAGQGVRQGLRSKALVRIYLSGIEIDDNRADRAGAFNDEVEIPASVDPGQYLMKMKKYHHKRKHHRKKRHRPDPCGCPASSWWLGV